MSIGSPSIIVDTREDLQPLADEILGQGYKVGYYEDPNNVDPNFCHGESKWCTNTDVGPHTTGREEEITSLELLKELGTGSLKSNPDRLIVSVGALLAYAYNIGKIPEGTYVICEWW